MKSYFLTLSTLYHIYVMISFFFFFFFLYLRGLLLFRGNKEWKSSFSIFCQRPLLDEENRQDLGR